MRVRETCEKVISAVTTVNILGRTSEGYSCCMCVCVCACSPVCVHVSLCTHSGGGDHCLCDRLVSNPMSFGQFMLTENDIGDRVQFTELARTGEEAIDPCSHMLPVVRASIHWKLAG